MFVEISETGIMSFLCDSRVQQVLQNFCQKNRHDAPLNMLIDDTERENDNFPGDSLPDDHTTMEDLDEELENIRQERELYFLADAARLVRISQAVTKLFKCPAENVRRFNDLLKASYEGGKVTSF